ncbi:hypothetical protein [Urbifossiella limnaea]|uniref:Uncharacterized protein n=1 Tax=Urbifossiella limnaea TaxID=2528023 RepID=A0A517XR25_9BACT|nr:hypothetical protein [Urbifossiella limnaea]QDU19953.1 hypothetical protein ETAA1_18930 [Urbifossiella limnaea]
MNASIMGMSTAGAGSLLGGVLLTAVGLKRRSLTGLLMTAAGGYLLYRGSRAARCALDPAACEPDKAKCDALRERLGAGVTAGIYDQTAQNRKEERAPSGDLIDDPVDDTVDDSFPCSDPPSYSPRNEAGALV